MLRGGSVGAIGLAAAACGGKGQRSPASTGQSTQGTAGAQGTAGPPQSGGTLTSTQTTNPPTLDPQRTTSYYALLQASAVYSRILRFKTGTDPKVAENHDVEGELATSYESPDAVTWTVKLRPDAKFHNVAPVNGHAVEAQDVKATFTRALTAQNPFRSSLDMIEPDQIESPDNATVVFKLKYPYAPFQSILASANYSWIFPREIASNGYDPAKVMIGSGPFLFDSYVPDVAASYKRNPDWFFKPQPNVSDLRWTVIPNAAQQRAQFTGGNLDFLGTSGQVQVNGFDIEALKRDDPKAQIVKSDPTAGRLFFVQLGDPASPFQDIRLRRAFSMAIDRDTIAKVIYNNDAVAQWYTPLNLGRWALHADQISADTAQYYKYDPANAKKLLQASGFGDQQFKLIYVTGYLGATYEKEAQTAANMLISAGFKVAPVSVDYTKGFVAGGKGIRYGNFDKDSLVFAGITNLADVDDYITNYYHTNATSGLSKLSDQNLDEQIAKARTIINVDERVKAYIDIQKYLADKMYTIAGFHIPYTYYLAAPRVQNFQATVGYGWGSETFSKLWLKA